MPSRFIRVYPDALDDALIESLIALPGAARCDLEWRRCSLTRVKGDAFGMFKRAIRPLVADYQTLTPAFNFCTELERPNVLRYEPAGDGPPDHFHEHADAWNVQTATRQISIVGYLNDVACGGETVFPMYGFAQRPVRGTVLMFPASIAFTHLARPPESGTKIAIVSWLHFGGDVLRLSASPLAED